MSELSWSNRAGGAKAEDADANAPESDSEPGGFALSVDFSACVGAQARCRVWVRRRARKVRWLANRVRRAAKLRGPLLLLAGEHLLPPGEPLRVLRPDDTLRVARVEQEWQHAFRFDDSDEDVLQTSPAIPAIVQSSPIQSNHSFNLITSTKQITRKSTHIVEPPLVVPVRASKRRFTVGDTIRMLNQTVEEPHTQTHSKQESPELLPEVIKQTKESGHLPEKSMTAMGHSLGSIQEDCDALNRVKRRALALLEQVAEGKEDMDVVDAPKKKRRRVRRRRPVRHCNPESLQDLDNSEIETMQNVSETQSQNTKDLSTKDKDNSESGTIQNGSGSQSTKKHLNQDESEPETTDAEDQDLELKTQNESEQSKSASLAQSSLLATPSTLIVATKPSPAMGITDCQEPVVFRNPTPPRAPRVVRALGSDTPRCDAAVGI